MSHSLLFQNPLQKMLLHLRLPLSILLRIPQMFRILLLFQKPLLQKILLLRKFLQKMLLHPHLLLSIPLRTLQTFRILLLFQKPRHLRIPLLHHLRTLLLRHRVQKMPLHHHPNWAPNHHHCPRLRMFLTHPVLQKNHLPPQRKREMLLHSLLHLLL